MNLHFDERGNLFPTHLQEATLAEVESFFVERIKESVTRKMLWINFLGFIDKFQKELNIPFEIWLDGSFISEKRNPRDIDAVFMIDYQTVEQKKSVLESKWFTRENKLNLNLDLYYSIEYPPSHKRYFLTHLNHLYWQDVYGHTRKDSLGRQYKKGFISLKID